MIIVKSQYRWCRAHIIRDAELEADKEAEKEAAESDWKPSAGAERSPDKSKKGCLEC